jgi:Peptidase family S51
MCELGWKSLGVLALTALPSIEEEHWVPMVQETDALLVGGGDPLHLCYWMRQSGLADLLPSLRQAVYVGVSAGSMVMGPSIGHNFVRWNPPTGAIGPWDWLSFRYFRIWTTRASRRTLWRARKNGPPPCRCLGTRLTIRPPSR